MSVADSNTMKKVVLLSVEFLVPADSTPPEEKEKLAILEETAENFGWEVLSFSWDAKHKSDEVMKDSETTPDRRSSDRRSSENGQVPGGAPYLVSPAENKDGTPDEDDEKLSEDDGKASKTNDYSTISPAAKKDDKTPGLSQADDDDHEPNAAAPEDKSIEGAGMRDETASVGDDINSESTKQPSGSVSEENLKTKKPSESDMVLEEDKEQVSPVDDSPSVRDDTKKTPTDAPTTTNAANTCHFCCRCCLGCSCYPGSRDQLHPVHLCNPMPGKFPGCGCLQDACG